MEPKTIEFKIRGEPFVMKEPLGYDDAAIIVQFTQPNGLINTHEVMCVRLSKALVSPPMGVQDVRKLPASVFNTLMAKWIELTEPDRTAFLEPQPT